MVYAHDNIEGLDASILMHPTVWKASGHLDAFHDPLIDDKACGRRYKADQLIEVHIEKLRTRGKEEQAASVHKRLVDALHADDMPQALHAIIMEQEILGPDSGAFDWTDVRQFNMMFETRVGAVDGQTIYLRPETAQGIFVNFHNVRETARLQVPFGIAQIGKAFRNEIVARQFTFRMREFEQMEMQYFVQPGKQQEAYEMWREKRWQWHMNNGIAEERLRWHVHDKPAHYADAAVDIQYDFPIGWQEIEGIHSRTDYDLSRHQSCSGKKMTYFDPRTQDRYVPYVVETSAGLDRTVLMLLCDAYHEEKVDGASRVVMKFNPSVAPIKVAVLPLVRKAGMPEYARAIFEDLQQFFNCFYDEKGSIGKRYRRMDEAGTPLCITVDGDSTEDGSVTVRDRDTLRQERIAKDAILRYVIEAIRS